jgi:hypothetical protein
VLLLGVPKDSPSRRISCAGPKRGSRAAESDGHGRGYQNDPDEDVKNEPGAPIAKGYGDADRGQPIDQPEGPHGEQRIHDEVRPAGNPGQQGAAAENGTGSVGALDADRT